MDQERKFKSYNILMSLTFTKKDFSKTMTGGTSIACNSISLRVMACKEIHGNKNKNG